MIGLLLKPLWLFFRLLLKNFCYLDKFYQTEYRANNSDYAYHRHNRKHIWKPEDYGIYFHNLIYHLLNHQVIEKDFFSFLRILIFTKKSKARQPTFKKAVSRIKWCGQDERTISAG